jgi:phage/plasmid-associated DNA primase
MCPWSNGIVDIKGCTTGKIHDAYREWCRRNNNGFVKSGKEFRDELAAYLLTTFADMSTRRNGNTFYRDYTLTQEAQMELLK